PLTVYRPRHTLCTRCTPPPLPLSTCCPSFFVFFFFNDPATPEIYTLSLHDALPISARRRPANPSRRRRAPSAAPTRMLTSRGKRSEEHTSELQSRENLVCRLLLEKKKKDKTRSE